MKSLSKLLTVLVLLAVAGFSAFGFLATYEPLPPATQWMWRAVYAGLGLARVLGIAQLAFRRK
jgi:hypothetical protein